MATAVKDYELTRKIGFKIKRVPINGIIFYAVLEYRTIFRFLKEFKMWRYVREKGSNQIRMFKDLRSAQAYINYQTNPDMRK